MKVEILIYAYLVVCAAMILFNIACIFAFRHKDKKIDSYSSTFTDRIREQIELPQIDEGHRQYLSKKLRRINYLMAFDKTLEELYPTDPEKIQRYLEKLSSVFIYLTLEYHKKSKLQAAFFPYIIKKYQVFRGMDISIITDTMLELVYEDAFYCRENALQALYTIGNADSVLMALRSLDEGNYYYHPKQITDGLLNFTGDRERLNNLLWDRLYGFSEKMKVTVLDYFRFSSGAYCEPILHLLTSGSCSDEAAYSCIRYFGKYHYEPAYPCLMDFAVNADEAHWEYTAITATALANYPCDKTYQVLKELLHSNNWYIRYNASESLLQSGFDYTDLIDVFEGDDRYASEILRYRLDQQKMKEMEVSTVDLR